MEKLLNDLRKRFYQIKVLDQFGIDNDDDSSEAMDLILDWVQENFPEVNVNESVFHGVSKLVIDLFPREEFVIKIPFNGCYWGKWDKETEEYDAFHQWCEFEYAPTPETQMAYNWDYCNTEVEKYLDIVDKGLECFFAETKMLCSSKNFYPIYIQEKVLPIREYSSSSARTPSKDSLKRAKEIRNERTCYISNVEWLANALEFYGEELTNIFLDYLRDDDIVGQDLHSGNYGYRVSDGSPCILDYSSWND